MRELTSEQLRLFPPDVTAVQVTAHRLSGGAYAVSVRALRDGAGWALEDTYDGLSATELLDVIDVALAQCWVAITGL